jgi:hypothetical protein
MATTMDNGETRARTDAGETGDKIKVSDPAAAAAETDAEASGRPTGFNEAMASLRQLMGWVAERSRPGVFGAVRQPADAAYQRRLGIRLMVWTALLCAAGILAGILSLPRG